MSSSANDSKVSENYRLELRTRFRAVVARYGRGNVLLQKGRFMTQDDLEDIRKRGDRAAKKLRQKLKEL